MNTITWAYEYYNRRLLKYEKYTWGDPNPNSNWTFTHHVEPHGHVSALQDPLGMVDYAPNALGQPTKVGSYATNVHYHANGMVSDYTLGNSVVHSVSLNARGLPAIWADTGVARDVYAYDANGNVTGITDEQQGVNRSMPWYDGLDRLRQANGSWGAGSFNYDALDNLRSSTVGGRSLEHVIDTATNRLIGLSGTQNMAIGYDANGNVSARGSQGFGFDLGNRLITAVGKASYAYDGHGRRNLSWFSDGTYRHDAYTQDGKLRLWWKLGQGAKRFAYLGDKLIAETTEFGVTTYNHTDALGSPVAKTNGSGVVTERTRYEPYGATVAGSTNPTGIGFTGHVNDPDTGLVYMQQRYYDPVAGRFLSVDPVTTDAKSGSHFNRYVYAENNPYTFFDPDGRQSTKTNLVLSAGLSATLFKGDGLGVLGSNGQQLQGFSLSLTLSVSLTDPQIALSIGGNDLTGTGLFVGGGAVLGAGTNQGPISSGPSKYDSAEAAVGIGKVQVGAQVTANKESAAANVGTKAGVGAGAYVAKGSGEQTTIATPALSQIKQTVTGWIDKLLPTKENK